MLLLERKKISAPELAKMFEVKLRTIYRDIETISMAGIPIITYRGADGGFGITEEYKIKKSFLLFQISRHLLIRLGNIHSGKSERSGTGRTNERH